MRMVTDWYRAFRFQVCPYSRFLEFHYKGIGIQRREQPGAQVGARILREMIASIMAGEVTADHAGDFAYNDFLQFGRERGYDGGNNSFAIAKETAEKLRKIVRNFRFDPAFKVLKAGKETKFNLFDETTFASRPVAVVSRETGAFYLYFIKVANYWKEERVQQMRQDPHLLSEVEAVREAYPGDFGGAIVQVISVGKCEYETPFLIGYDEGVSADYIEQIKAQESTIEMVLRHPSAFLIKNSNMDAAKPTGFFAQHRHACNFPYPCQFKQICWGDLRGASQPETDPRFMVREPELITEKELVASWRKS